MHAHNYRSVRIAASLIAVCTGFAMSNVELDTPYRMNRGALFSEDESSAAKLQAAVNKLITALSAGDFNDTIFDPDDLERNEFYYTTLRKLQSSMTDDHPYPLVLKSFSSTDADHHIITIAFMKSDNDTAEINKIIEFFAHPHNSGYRFTSPFEYNTRDLNTHQINDVTFHAAGNIDLDQAKAFVEFKQRFEKLS